MRDRHGLEPHRGAARPGVGHRAEPGRRRCPRAPIVPSGWRSCRASRHLARFLPPGIGSATRRSVRAPAEPADVISSDRYVLFLTSTSGACCGLDERPRSGSALSKNVRSQFLRSGYGSLRAAMLRTPGRLGQPRAPWQTRAWPGGRRRVAVGPPQRRQGRRFAQQVLRPGRSWRRAGRVVGFVRAHVCRLASWARAGRLAAVQRAPSRGRSTRAAEQVCELLTDEEVAASVPFEISGHRPVGPRTCHWLSESAPDQRVVVVTLSPPQDLDEAEPPGRRRRTAQSPKATSLELAVDAFEARSPGKGRPWQRCSSPLIPTDSTTNDMEVHT